jgi:YebC/PmpR family DNA-binding regulatory protein
MAGHSKWANIKHKKAATDKKRGKIFTKHARMVTIAAKGGGDPYMNPTLATAIANAKADNVPNDNIERAIKKGAGGDGSDDFKEIVYEGYGPGGVAMMIVCLSDNHNRSLTAVRTVMGKNGGSMGSGGCVSYLFERKGVIEIQSDNSLSTGSGSTTDDVEMAAIEAGAEDVEAEEGVVTVYTEPESFAHVFAQLEKYNVQNKEVTMVPSQEKLVDNVGDAKKMMKLIDLLEDIDDVSDVYTNMTVDDEVACQLE